MRHERRDRYSNGAMAFRSNCKTPLKRRSTVPRYRFCPWRIASGARSQGRDVSITPVVESWHEPGDCLLVPVRLRQGLEVGGSFCGTGAALREVSPVGMDVGGTVPSGRVVRVRVEVMGCVRGRPGLLWHSARVGSGPAT